MDFMTTTSAVPAPEARQGQLDPNHPSIQIRTDLWNTMSLAELTRQRELVLDRIGVLRNIPDQGNPSIQSLHSALQFGLADITRLIDSKTGQPQQR